MWQVWTCYEEGRCHFAPFASISIRGAILDWLCEAYEVLNVAEREFIHWYFVEGLSQAECVEKAGVFVAGIKKRLEIANDIL